jgi:hypothetical protein
MTVELISHCSETWLVGVNGRSVFRRQADVSGEVGGAPCMGFGDDTLASLPPVGESYPCPACGAGVPTHKKEG